MPSEKQTAQLAYIKMLLDKANALALENPSELLIDPQGRVLIDVVLTAEELVQARKDFGREEIQPVTTVSLDIFADDLKKVLIPFYEKTYGINQVQVNQLVPFRGSIIPLLQEYNFHLRLAARLYTRADSTKFPQERMRVAHQQAMRQIQKLVSSQFQYALLKATERNGTINSVRFIRELDRARKKIAVDAHLFLFEEVVKVTGHKLDKNELKNIKANHLAELTTATPNDILHTDVSLGQCTWIAGSERTAHDRGVDKLDDREILIFSDNEEEQSLERFQIRTSSLDVKRGILPEVAIDDIEKKILAIKNKYKLESVLSAKNVFESRAIIYNLFTALNDSLEGGKNKQSQGASFILRGAHQYNETQLHAKKPVYCYVQNISVNGFGDSLGYDGNVLKTEATLMAEIAMLHSLATENEKDAIIYIVDLYKTFLMASKSNLQQAPFFSQTTNGKQAINLIFSIKVKWDTAAVLTEPKTSVDKAKAALRIMMGNNLHFKHEFAMLFQSLSVFVEDASLNGCKSGNERAQAVNGRVAILKSVAFDLNNRIVSAIDELSQQNPEQAEAYARKLKQALDAQYDLNLQSAVSLISAVDQGAAAKLNAKFSYIKARENGLGIGASLKKALVSLFNRNYAEESLPHLHQGNAGKMQAHKGLVSTMSKSLPKESMGYWAYMRSKVGVVGIVFSIIVLPVALVGGIVGAIFHSQHQRKVQKDVQKIASLIKEGEAERSKRQDTKQPPAVTPQREVLEPVSTHSLWRDAHITEIKPDIIKEPQYHDIKAALEDIKKSKDPNEEDTPAIKNF